MSVTALKEDSQFQDLCFIIIRRRCIVLLKTGDCSVGLQSITNPDRKFLEQVLREIQNSSTSCSLEFCGSLRKEAVDLLPPCLSRLHLLLGKQSDIQVLKAVTAKLDTRDLHLEELHVSVYRSIKTHHLQKLKMSFLQTRFCLHFPKARDEDVEWIADITDKMDYPSISYVKSVDEIFLAGSTLTVAGARKLLSELTRSRGFSRKYPVFLESKTIHEAAKQDLIDEYVSRGSNITFDVDIPKRNVARTRGKTVFKHWLFMRRYLEEYIELLCLILLVLILAQLF